MREMPYIQPYHVGNRRGGNQNILDEFREFLDARGGRGRWREHHCGCVPDRLQVGRQGGPFRHGKGRQLRSAEGRHIGALRRDGDEKTGDGRSPKRHFSRSLDLAARPCAQPIA